MSFVQHIKRYLWIFPCTYLVYISSFAEVNMNEKEMELAQNVFAALSQGKDSPPEDFNKFKTFVGKVHGERLKEYFEKIVANNPVTHEEAKNFVTDMIVFSEKVSFEPKAYNNILSSIGQGFSIGVNSKVSISDTLWMAEKISESCIKQLRAKTLKQASAESCLLFVSNIQMYATQNSKDDWKNLTKHKKLRVQTAKECLAAFPNAKNCKSAKAKK